MADTLLIKINATTATLKAELKEAQDTVKGFADKIGVDLKRVDAHFDKVGGGVSKLGAVAAGAAGGGIALLGAKLLELPGTLIEITRAALEYSASLKDTAAQLSVSTTFLQQFRTAAMANGATLVGADTALGKFSASLGSAFNGQSKAAVKSVTDALKGTGATLADLAKLSDTDRYLKIADGIAAIKDPAQQAAVALRIFGQGYKQVLPLLREGSEGFKRATEDAARFGIVLTEGQIAHANETASKIESLNRALQTRIAGVVDDNSQAIGMLAEKLAELAAWAIKAGTQFIGFANIVKSRGFLTALATTNGNDLAAAATPSGARKQAGEGMKAQFARLEDLKQRVGQRAGGREIAIAQRDFDAARANYNRFRRAELQADAPPAKVKSTGQATITAPASGRSGGKRSRGAGGSTPVDRFPTDLARAEGDVLQAQLNLAVDAGERARIQRVLLEADRREADARIDAEKNLTAAQKEQLKALNAQVASARGAAIDREQDEKGAQDSLSLRLAENSAMQDQVRAAIDLADTAGERRKAELELLELQIQEKGARLDAILASKTSMSAEKEGARREVDRLPGEKARGTVAIVKGTMSPLESYLDGIPNSADQVNESLQRIAAEGLQSLNDGITEAIVSGKSLGTIFKSVANQIISDLVRIAVQKAIVGPIADALLGGLGAGGIFGSIFGKRATGGPVTSGRPYLVGERGPELIVPHLSGSVVANDNLRGGGGSVALSIELTDLTGKFDSRVIELTVPIANASGQRAAMAGADLAGARASVQSARRLA